MKTDTPDSITKVSKWALIDSHMLCSRELFRPVGMSTIRVLVGYIRVYARDVCRCFSPEKTHKTDARYN